MSRSGSSRASVCDAWLSAMAPPLALNVAWIETPLCAICPGRCCGDVAGDGRAGVSDDGGEGVPPLPAVPAVPGVEVPYALPVRMAPIAALVLAGSL